VKVPLSESVRNSLLNALCRNTSYANASVWVKLHTGDPGAAGTANAAGETTRQQSTFGSVASGGAISNTAAVAWTSVSTSETYTHASLWSASTAGTFLGSAALTQSKTVNSGDNFSVPIGDLDVQIT
jgi:hypothetical protein